jgi:hypothetical protein
MRLIRFFDVDLKHALDGITAQPSFPRFVPDAGPAATRGCAVARANLSFNHSTFVT